MLGQSISRTGFDMRASDWTGALRMVAPARATIDGGMLFGVDVPLFATLDVTFAPEPGAATMLAVALAGLACRCCIGRPR